MTGSVQNRHQFTAFHAEHMHCVMRLAFFQLERWHRAAFGWQIKTVHSESERWRMFTLDKVRLLASKGQSFWLFQKDFCRGRRPLPSQSAGEFLQLRLLFRVQVCRHFHLDADMQVAVAMALQIFNALAFDAETAGRVGCRAGILTVALPSRVGTSISAPKRGLDETDRHFAEQIVAFAWKISCGFTCRIT